MKKQFLKNFMESSSSSGEQKPDNGGAWSSASPSPPPPPNQPPPLFIFGQNHSLKSVMKNNVQNPTGGSRSSALPPPPPLLPPNEPPMFIFGQNPRPKNPDRQELVGKNEKNKKYDGKNAIKKEVSENEVQEEEIKRWNLRPRKPIQQINNNFGVESSSGTQKVQEKKNEEKKKKKNPNVPIMPTFSPTLTKEEIREDFIKMTGKPPPAKPKTRRKVKKEVQDNLDKLQMGALLNLVTLKDYEA